MLSGSGTYCVKSCVLDTQSPLKARHVAPVYDRSVSVIRWEPEAGEPLEAIASLALAKARTETLSQTCAPWHIHDTHVSTHTETLS